MMSLPVSASRDDLATTLESAFYQLPFAFALIETGSRLSIAFGNSKFQDELGMPNIDVSGKSIDDLFLTQTALLLRRAVGSSVTNGEVVRLALTDFGVDRRTRFDVTIAPLEPAKPARPGGLVLLSATRRQAATTPRLSASTLGQLEALGEGLIFVIDLVHRRARYLPPELADMIGHNAHEALDLEALRSFVHPEDFDPLVGYFEQLKPAAANASSVTMRVRRPDDSWLWFELRGRGLTWGRDGKAKTVLGVAVDVTDRRTMTLALRSATEAIQQACEQERRRVARNLHDSTAQHLVAVDLSLSSLERRLTLTPGEAAILEDIREALDAAHREIRTYSYLLHPPTLQNLGLEGTLKRFVEGFGRRSEFAIQLQVNGPPVSIASDVELTLFRVAQEAVMNIHRHAKASCAIVRLSRAPHLVVLEVEDDGIGLARADDGDAFCEGVGIPGMRARMAQIGGVLSLHPHAKGLCVRAEAPT